MTPPSYPLDRNTALMQAIHLTMLTLLRSVTRLPHTVQSSSSARYQSTAVSEAAQVSCMCRCPACRFPFFSREAISHPCPEMVGNGIFRPPIHCVGAMAANWGRWAAACLVLLLVELCAVPVNGETVAEDGKWIMIVTTHHKGHLNPLNALAKELASRSTDARPLRVSIATFDVSSTPEKGGGVTCAAY